MSRTTLVQKGRPYPFLPVQITVINPTSARQTTISENCKVDTGFSGDVFVADYRISDIMGIDVKLYQARAILADGSEVIGKHCSAKLVKIADYDFTPQLDIVLTFYGSPKHPLLGLRLLNKWITELHGPKQLLSLISEQSPFSSS